MPYEIDTDPDGLGCWNWTGYVAPDGTPVVRTKTSTTTARRWVWKREGHKLRDDQVLWNVCGNALCVMPLHADAISKGEAVHREGHIVLNRYLAKRAQELLMAGLGIRQLSRLFGVDPSVIRAIRDGEHWAVRGNPIPRE